jgi:S1-C subfamily serine protease
MFMRHGFLAPVPILALLAAIYPSTHSYGSDWERINKATRSSMVFIEVTRSAPDGSGREVLTSSGFLIRGSEGWGLTVAHAVPDERDGQIVKYRAAVGAKDAPLQDLIVIKRDEALDIALFRIAHSEPTAKGLTININPSAEPGSALGAWGFSFGSNLRFVNGNLSNPIGDKGRWVTSLGLNRGDSGGPVFDERGTVVGISVGGLSDANGIAYVIPANLLTFVLPANLLSQSSSRDTYVSQSTHADAWPPGASAQGMYRVVGVASNDVLRVRAEPSANGREVSRLQYNDRGISKLDCVTGGWCRIRHNGRDLGYVNVKFLALDSEDAADAGASACDSLNSEAQGKFTVIGVKRGDTLKLRGSPSATSSNVIGDIPPTAMDVTVGRCTAGWCLVKYDGQCGYAASAYLSQVESGEAPEEN